jgi:ferrous iron transport protein A
MDYTLRTLQPGARGIVTDIRLDDELKKRMEEFGLIPDTVVECVGRSPLGDPASYRIRGVILALRARDAEQILLRR